MKPLLIYDTEIVAAIPPRKGGMLDGIRYCGGWRDFAGMGISTLCAFDEAEGRYRVFCQDNLSEFAALAKERTVVSFNGLAFDDKLCQANGIDVHTDYDILVEVWAAVGLGPEFDVRTHGGYGLDALLKANDLPAKSGHGESAPIMWQQGKRGAVIDYCLNDVHLTRRLLDCVIFSRKLISPKTGEPLTLRPLVDGTDRG